MSQKDGFAGECALADFEKLSENAFVWIGPIAHLCLECDAIIHIVHSACFCNHRLAGIEFYLNDLHVITDNLVVNFMTFHPFFLLSSLIVRGRITNRARIG